jgi:hypothetical protein
MLPQRAKQLWSWLDGYKLLIGLSLDFIQTHLLPTGTWYSDLVGLVAYAIIVVGGGHKIVKTNYGKQIVSKLRQQNNSV